MGSHRKLYPSHVDQLLERGITLETAEGAGLYSESDRNRLAKIVGWKGYPAKYGAAVVFPYRDGGREILSRIKPDNPPFRNGKRLKYLQPKGVGGSCYFPPGVRELVNAGRARILITEGEFKALKATQEGFATIGLPGVSMWNRPKSVSLCNDLASIDWKGRTVYIAFDSDAVEKAEVALEESKLAAALTAEGAAVRVVRLPAGPPDAAGEPTKLGLDDFLVHYGPGALEKLIEQAQPADEIDPGSLKCEAKQADPADTAKHFLAETAIDGESRIRFYQGAFWYYSGSSYRELAEGDLRAKAVEFLSDRFVMVKGEHASNLLEHVRAKTLVPAHLFQPIWLPPRSGDEPPAVECVSFRNGIVHLPAVARGEAKLLPSTPRFFTTCGPDFAFDPSPPKPERFLRFLGETFGDDWQSVELLQDWFGYCLTADTRQQKCLLIVGPKRSGKGTMARVLTAMLGKGNVAAPTLAGLGENFGLQSLLGKPLAIIHDARLSGRTDQAKVVERLLSITGEDHQTVDRKYRDPITVKLPTRFMVMSNELPRLSDSSGALVGRMLLLETPNSVYGREDHHLTDALLEELPGIFAWAVEGWVRLQQRGRFVQPDAALERLEDLAELSSPVKAFLGERCVVDPGQQTAKKHVYASWRSWCESHGLRPTGESTFARDLLAAAPAVRSSRVRLDGSRERVFNGLGLMAPSEWGEYA
ncbi:phage/plasmid primase, P4 family [Botrimarina sp.]|uniref:phage/plasmid primase, P4 family n=1 Tax=Botrimarina sp. TaxID=2795802 RepID=UPI0032EF66FE